MYKGPSRLIAEKEGKSKQYHRQCTIFQGDDNVWYDCAELAAFAGITPSGMRNRITKKGYDYEFIMAKKVHKGLALDGSRVSSLGTEAVNYSNAGNAEWQGLKG